MRDPACPPTPAWPRSRLINARAETLHDRPAYRSLVGSRRALLPFSAFYEWRRPGPGGPSTKQPFYFYRPDGDPLVFAGLWDIWHDAEGEPLRTCAIITTTANNTLATVHQRMPVLLPPGAWDEWLKPGPLSPERLADLLVPAPDDLLAGYPVSQAVNSALQDGPELIEPLACPDLPATPPPRAH